MLVDSRCLLDTSCKCVGQLSLNIEMTVYHNPFQGYEGKEPT